MESRWFQRKGGRGEDENRGWVLESKGGLGTWRGGVGGGAGSGQGVGGEQWSGWGVAGGRGVGE